MSRFLADYFHAFISALMNKLIIQIYHFHRMIEAIEHFLILIEIIISLVDQLKTLAERQKACCLLRPTLKTSFITCIF